LGAWFFTSLVIDIVAVPAVFRNVSKIAEAGTVGMIVFSKYNILELVFALGLLITAYFNRSVQYFKYFFSVLVLLTINALLYTFYLSPSIIKINEKLYNDSTAEAVKNTLQHSHDFFHQLYVGLEKGKVLILLLLIIFSLIQFSKLKKERL
jgi:hypothetical protein